MQEDFKDGYYHYGEDFESEEGQNSWCDIVFSKRGPGKTYSGLRYAYEHNIKFIYLKRTIDDVDLILSKNKFGFDPSPFVPLNRDGVTKNVKAEKIRSGLGAFYTFVENEETNEEEPIGEPLGYILALSAIKKFKGFDFSVCDWIIFDEFIPQAGEKVSKKEGEQILDLYMTVSRDRLKRGRKPLKLIMFANSETLICPVLDTLEVSDIIAEMTNKEKKSRYYDPEREIFIHYLSPDEFPVAEEEKVGIYKAMIDTAWGKKSFLGEFDQDFSTILDKNIKYCSCYCDIIKDKKHIYIWINNRNNEVYVSYSRPGKAYYKFDLSREGDQRNFYSRHLLDIRQAFIESRIFFEKFSLYHLFIDYEKIYRVNWR